MKANCIHEGLVCSLDVNSVVKNLNIVKKNTESVLIASKEVGLEVESEKTNCIRNSCLVSRLHGVTKRK